MDNSHASVTDNIEASQDLRIIINKSTLNFVYLSTILAIFWLYLLRIYICSYLWQWLRNRRSKRTSGERIFKSRDRLTFARSLTETAEEWVRVRHWFHVRMCLWNTQKKNYMLFLTVDILDCRLFELKPCFFLSRI